MEKWESKGYNMIEKKNNKLMVISMSGGLDSSTLAARALAEGYLVLPVNFYYGQVNEVEIQAQRTIVNQLKMVYGYDKVLNSVHINLSYSLGDAIHNWQKNRDIGKYNDDLALEYYMPSRNLLFMSLAAVLGEIVAKDMPEVIIDDEEVMPKVFENIPDLAKKYKMTGTNVFELIEKQ